MNEDPVSEAELATIETHVWAASPAPWHSWIEDRWHSVVVKLQRTRRNAHGVV